MTDSGLMLWILEIYMMGNELQLMLEEFAKNHIEQIRAENAEQQFYSSLERIYQMHMFTHNNQPSSEGMLKVKRFFAVGFGMT